jgi:hypothetical protein
MRRVVACVVAIALAVMAAGCNLQQDRNFYREGIGSDLNWSGLAQQTQILEQYISFICEQAGFPTVVVDGVLTCSTTNLSPKGWAEFVQAGMNDIDRRCDAYLVWLDDKKRSREPIIKQFMETSVATQAIMRLTGVGVDPITIAGIAFGLAQDTFTNVYSRLLTEIDKSTVQAVVINEQNDFRRTIALQTIDTRSTAIYALRSYLRLCMPYTIETRINTTVTFAQQGGNSADNKLVDATTVGITTVRNVLPAPKPIPVVNKMPTPMSSREETISKEMAASIQTGFGIASPDGDFGPQDSATRDELKQFERGFWRVNSISTKKPIDPNNIRGIVSTDAELNALNTFAATVRSCKARPGFRTNYEAGVWMALPGKVSALLDKALSEKAVLDAKAANKLTTIPVITKNTKRSLCKIEDDLRNAIVALKTVYGLDPTPDITDPLMLAITNTKGP